MKKKLFLIFVLGFTFTGFAQQTINGSIIHEGMQRDYILYVPASYSGAVSVPLVLNFHGFGSNATEQMWYGDFRSIADTAGFLIVHPEGTLFNGTSHWNVGGWTVGSTVDDVGFTSALIDSLSTTYNIDGTRVFSTGMSNGGFMSFLLACQLSERIAAIASVTGSMTPETYNNGNPQHPMPVMQIHGTADNLVPYEGVFYAKSIVDVLNYWITYNNCDLTPEFTELEDIDPDDGSTVESYIYGGGDNGVTVEHFKILGGGHTWPGNAYGGEGTNYDMDASLEIWKFFSKYDINGLIEPTGKDEFTQTNLDIKIFPNPTRNIFSIEGEILTITSYRVTSVMGKTIMSGLVGPDNRHIDISQLPPDVYFLRIGDHTFKVIKSR
jgi:polyhydroxybutyrate depolymerase